MPQDLVRKLRIKEGNQLLLLHAPENFLAITGKLPAGAEAGTKILKPDQLHWFLKNKAQLKKELPEILKLLKAGTLVWAYFPKGSSGLQTDLTRDHGWEPLLAVGDRLIRINLISFDDTWSVFGFRLNTGTTVKKTAGSGAKSEIANWIDPVKKQVRIPGDLSVLLNKYPVHKSFFESLAYTHKKEYVEWIVTAKKAETRARRLTELIRMLDNKKKNPTEN